MEKKRVARQPYSSEDSSNIKQASDTLATTIRVYQEKKESLKCENDYLCLVERSCMC